MRQQPLAIISICFILGILIQELQNFYFNLLYLFGLTCTFTFICYYKKTYPFILNRKYSLYLSFLLLGGTLHQLNQEHTIPNPDKKGSIVFKLDKKLNSNEKNRRYEVIAIQNRIPFKAILSVPKKQEELNYKHYYKANAFINRVEIPKNSYQFNYAKYLGRKNIYHQIYLPYGYTKNLRHDLSLVENIKQKRSSVLHDMDKLSMSSKSREFLKGIILADRTEMDKQTVSDFSKTGLAHILAISGSHMVVIFGIFLALFKVVIPASKRNLAIICSLVCIWIFTIFIDYGNPVVRSSIMLTVYFTYVLLQRKTDLLHSMAVAAFIILCFNTQQLFDVGFQLSFIAVLGIYWLNKPILKYFPKPKNNFQLSLFSIPSITISAQLSTLPLVLYYFHEYSLISIIANLVIIPLAEIIIVFSILLVVFVFLKLNFIWLESLYDWMVMSVLKIINWFATFESVSNKNIPFSIPEIAFFIVFLYFLRFGILKFNKENGMRIAFSFSILIFVHVVLNYTMSLKEEMIVHHYFKSKIYSIKENGKVYFWIPEKVDSEKVEKYIINPYLTSIRAKDYDITIHSNDITTIVHKNKTYNLNEFK